MNYYLTIFDNKYSGGILYKNYIKEPININESFNENDFKDKNFSSNLTSQIQKDELIEYKKKEIEKWLKENTHQYKFETNYKYKINNDLTIDIDGNTIINDNVSEFPYKFNIINGDFD